MAIKKEIPLKINAKYQRDKDREKVRGIFHFHEVPGGVMSFCFKAYKEDPIETFTLIDGQIYELPLGVARHLNKNVWYPQYEHISINGEKEKISGGYSASLFGNSGPGMRVAKKIRRCSFQSLEFIQDEDLTPVGPAVIMVETTL